MTGHEENLWTRRGAEGADEDWLSGERDPATREDIRSALAAYHDEDLMDLEGEGVTEALDVMVDAYVEAYKRLGGTVLP